MLCAETFCYSKLDQVDIVVCKYQTSVAIRKTQALFPLASKCIVTEECKLIYITKWGHYSGWFGTATSSWPISCCARDGQAMRFARRVALAKRRPALRGRYGQRWPFGRDTSCCLPQFLEHHSHLWLVDGNQVPKEEKMHFHGVTSYCTWRIWKDWNIQIFSTTRGVSDTTLKIFFCYSCFRVL